MKNDDAHDPLKKNEFDEKKPGTSDKNFLKEEKENLQTPEVQENTSQAPDVKGVAPSKPDPSSDSSSEPDSTSEPDPAPEPDPTSEPDSTSEPDPAPEPDPTSKKDPTSEPDPASKKDPTAEPEPPSTPDEDAKPEKKKTVAQDHEKLIDDEEELQINASLDHEAYDDKQEEEAQEERKQKEQAQGEEDREEEDLDEPESEDQAAVNDAKNPAAGSPEEGTDESEAEEERVNFSLLSLGDMVKLMREKLDHPAKGNLRKDVAEIKQAFYEKVNASNEEKKEHFLEAGGNIEDFKPVEDPLEGEMRVLLQKYRELKAEYSRQLEQTKQENLKKKQEILEQLRILMEGQENFEITFRKFKDLQKQWFAAGIVPQQNLKDLWDSYNYFVEKFNDYVRINRELRTLDLKKNLELKIQLCERTEALDQESNVVQAFRTLQKYHTRWREIGPVPRENRDEIWDRFKQATSVINRKHQEYHSRLKESLQENLDRKKELCEQVESIAAVIYKSHREWVDKTGQVLEIQKTWKTIGYAPKKDNNAIYARFRTACDTFFGNKARFYADAYEEQKDNLKQKLKITEKAEALVNSEDWKETTNELIRLQKQWKEIGPVPRRDSDKMWKRFRKACDTFFHNKSKYYEDIDSTFEDNLKAKEEIIRDMESYNPTGKKKEDLAAVENFQSRFNEIGYVPASKKDVIKDQFRKVQDQLLQRIGLGDSERSLFRFRNRIIGIMNSPRAQMKINFERDKLVNKLQQLRNDIGVWENNIGFFKQSDSSEETIQGFNEKIEAAHERIRLLEDKIRLLDDMENVN